MSLSRIRKTELLVVFGCLFISVSCVYALAYRSRQHAKQIQCAAHIRLNAQSIIGYGQDHDGDVTFNNAIWPMDIKFSATDVMMSYGSTRQSFYCPSCKSFDAYDARLWQYSMIYGTGTCFYPINQDRPELDSPVWRESNFRIITYCLLTDNSQLTRPSFKTPERDWVADLDSITNPAEYEMIVDKTISQQGILRFYDITSGGITALTGGALADQTNHLSKTGSPIGGNIGFVDGHVAYRPFDQMQKRLDYGISFWW